MKLHSYQQLAIQHLLTHERAALFMGLGLGKTLSTLAAFDGLRTMGHARTMLVVAPLRVCNLTWPNEIAKWPQFHHLTVANLRKKEGLKAYLDDDADIYLCNYEMLPKIAEQFEDHPVDVIVFDELTRAKNHKSKRINALREVLPPHVRRWGLTGTPTPNSLLELFAQVRLLDDGARLGRSFEHFKRTYFYPADYMEYDWQPLPGAPEKLHGKISDLALTLLSSEFLKLPDTVVIDLETTLPDEAAAQYTELERELLLSIGNGEEVIVAPNAAVLVNKLLQVTSGSVYNDQKKAVVLHDAKFKALQGYLAKHPEPALIAYNYRHELERLRKIPGAIAFEDYKTPKAQAELEARWNAGEINRLLVHPQSVGHGLNLQYGGSTIIWYSPTWSRELYDQLNGRIIRQGQTQLTTIVRILCPGTIDDAVIETLREKDLGQRALLQALTNFRKLLEK